MWKKGVPTGWDSAAARKTWHQALAVPKSNSHPNRKHGRMEGAGLVARATQAVEPLPGYEILGKG